MKAHVNAPRYSDIEIQWLDASGQHDYRGIGRSEPGGGGTVWGPCIVEGCDQAHEWEGHGRPTRTCNYCGSIHPEDLFALIDAGKVRSISWADWKYGWPHKLYVDHADQGHAKFYTEHLVDFPELIERFNTIGGRVTFEMDEVGLRWRRVSVAS